MSSDSAKDCYLYALQSAASTPLVSSQKTFNVKNMDLNELRNITKDNASAVDFLREKECLRRTPPSCPVCPKNMSLIKDTSYGYIWRCSAHKGKRVAIKKGSFFEKSHIPLTKVSDFNSFLCNSLATIFITAYLNSTQQNVKTLFM